MIHYIMWFKDLNRWDTKPQTGIAWYWNKEYLQKIGSIIKRKQIRYISNEPITMLSIHFNGSISKRPNKKTKSTLYVANKGDLVFSKIDIRNGAVGIIPEQYPVVGFTSEYPIYELNKNIALPEYIKIVFQSQTFKNYINSLVSGTSGRKRINPNVFEQIIIPLPPVDIQQKIITYRNSLNSSRDKYIENIKNYERDIEEYIYNELGLEKNIVTKKRKTFYINFGQLQNRWDVIFHAKDLISNKIAKYNWVTLKQFCISYQYGYDGKAIYKNNGYKFLRISDINYYGEYNLNKLPFVEISDKKINNFLLKDGDFLVARTGATAGKCTIVRNINDNNIIFASYLIRFEFSNEILPEFLEQYLNQGPGKKIVTDIVYSSGRPNINANQILQMLIPLPPLDIQNQISKHVIEIRQKIYQLRLKCDNVENSIKIEFEKIIQGEEDVEEISWAII